MSTTFAGGPASTASGGPSTGYPISVTYTRQASYSRFFAIPLIGYLAKTVLLIPHIIALAIVAIINTIIHLVAWIPVLTAGTYPQWAYNWSSGTIRWGVRVAAYFYGITDKYPPFSLGDHEGYPVQVAIEYPSNPGRFWAIPLVGFLVRYLALIPHLIIVYVLAYVVNLLQLVLWAPVLFGGTYPEWGDTLVGGMLRWGARVYGYLFGLTDKYPPFSLSN